MTHGMHAMTPLDAGAFGIVHIVGILLLLYVVLRVAGSIRRAWRFEAVAKSVAVDNAARFWTDALRSSDGRPTNQQRARFRAYLRAQLIEHYTDRGFFPTIGVAYHAPHDYGVDEVTYTAMRRAGIVSGINRDMDYLRFGKAGRMEITLHAVRFQDGGVGEFQPIA